VSLGKNEKYIASKMDEHQRDHSLYIAFAPADDPKIALAVIVENAGFGSTSAAPIARRVFDYVLLGQYPNEEDLLAVSKGQATAPIGKPRALADVPWPPIGSRAQ
jgi:penicillin-binding protein 2